ncbi:MAG: T9SS type A sorting domain-containing protein [Bacteroidales bacterium]|nr:T9SS type A sorting domain-containing protein [Bacteroidales bacterium]
MVNVQITNPNSPVTEFHVYDAYGKLIRVVDVQTAQIDLSRYASGVYFIKAVSDGNVVAVRKVVKQ